MFTHWLRSLRRMFGLTRSKSCLGRGTRGKHFGWLLLERLEDRTVPATFVPQTTLIATPGNQPFSEAIGDLNGNGKQDIVFGNGATPGLLSIEMGNGDGTFQSAGTISIGASIGFVRDVALVNLDGGQFPDLVATAFSGNKVVILQNTTTQVGAAPTFTVADTISVGSQPFWITTGDFDGDGKLDIVTGNFSGSSITVLPNTTTTPGDITFGTPLTIATPSGCRAVETIDINGKLDLVTANMSNGTVSIFQNTSTGPGNIGFSLASTITLPSGSAPNALAIADFNNDGLPDIAVGSFNTGNIYLLLNQGNGTFSSPTTIPVAGGGNTVDLIAGDFNGDGNTDVAAVDSTTKTVSVLYGNGAGAFPTVETYATGVMPWKVASGDFNGDGAPDLVVANLTDDTATVLLNQSAATALQVTPSTTTPNVATNFTVTVAAQANGTTYQNYNGTVTLTDSNGLTLGSHTFVPADHGVYTFTVSLPSVGADTLTASDGTLTGAAQLSSVDPAITLSPGPLPADTANALYNTQTISASGGTGALTLTTKVQNAVAGLVIPSTGAGSIAITGTPAAPGTETFSVTATDAFGGTTTANYSITVRTAAPFSFTTPIDFSGFTPLGVASADLNGDGKTDLVVGSAMNTTGQVTIEEGNGNGTFQNVGTYSIGPSSLQFVRSLTVADLDGDGKPDIIIADFKGNAITILPNTTPAPGATPTFGAPIVISLGTGQGPSTVVAGDFDGDGKIDLAVSSTTNASGGVAPRVIILRNTSTGVGTFSFAAPITVYTSTSASGLTAADVEGNGKIDLVAAGGSQITLLQNESTPGNINFVASPPVSVPGVAAGDPIVGNFAGDNKPDVAFINTQANNPGAVYILSNQDLIQGGSYPDATELTFANGGNGFALATGDFNGDGNADLAVAANGSNVYIFYGNGNGTFSNAETYTLPSEAKALATGDFNGDGAPDLVISDAGASEAILLDNAAATTLQVTPSTATPDEGTDFTVTVTAQYDGATYQNYDRTVTLTSTDPGAPVLGAHTFVPSDDGSYTFTVDLPSAEATTIAASDGTLTGTAQVTVVPAPTVVQALPADTVSVAYNQTITPSFGTGPYTLSVSNVQNSLPGLLVPSNDGGAGVLNIGGTPTAFGTMVFTVLATDSLNNTTTTTYSITVNPALTLNPPTLPADTATVPYNQVVSASGGTGSVTLDVTNVTNAIPGLNLPVSGSTIAVTGTPTAAGTETFTVTATDALGDSVSTNYSITVNPPVSFNPSSTTLPADTVGLAYTQTVTAGGGTGAVTLSIAGVQGAVPGVNIVNNGSSITISGTPTANSASFITITAVDAVGDAASIQYELQANPIPSLSVNTIPGDTIGVAYNESITDTGGTGTVTLSLGTITSTVAGISVVNNGTSIAVSGTPTTTGTIAFSVTATDSLGVATTVNYSIAVLNPVPTVSNVSINSAVDLGKQSTLTGTINGPADQPFTLNVNWGDGTGVQTYNLPAGSTTFSETHTYAGIGADSVNVTIGDSDYSNNLLYGASGTVDLDEPPGQLYVFDLNTGIATLVGSLPGEYVSEIAVNNATGQAVVEYGNGYNYQMGQLLNIDTGAAIGGLITNNPAVVFNGLAYIGNTLYGISAPDPGDETASSLSILDPVTGDSTLIGATGDGPISGLAYDPATGILYGIDGGSDSTNLVTINISTGVATPLFSTGITGGSLSFAPDGQLYAGSSDGQLYRVDLATNAVTLVSTDSNPSDAIAGLTMGNDTADVQTTVNPAITLSAAPLSPVFANVPYNQTITAGGGAGAIMLAVSNIQNAIAGLNVPGSGVNSLAIGGTPTATGTETFTVTATDAIGGTTTSNYSITVLPTLSNVSITSPADPNIAATLTGSIVDANAQDAFTLVVNWGDGSAPQTFNYAAGTTTFSEPHTYSTSGSYSVSLTLGDTQSAGAVLYASTANGPGGSDGQLYAYNLTTGAATLVGALPGSSVTEIAYDNFAGQAWLQYGSNVFEGQQININTGAAIGGPVNDSPAENFNSLAFNGTTLYASGTATTGGTSPSDLRILNPVTGTSTLIGMTGINGPLSGLAFDPNTGILYGIRGGNVSTNNLVTLNLNTGAATVLFSTGFAGGSLGFGPDGQLYAGSNSGQLYQINLATHAVTPVGTAISSSAVSGLALVDTAPLASAVTQVTVNPAVVLGTAALPADTINVPYDQTISAIGGTGNITLTVTNIQNAIPGLAIPSTGANSLNIGGTPTASGTETFTVIATDAVGGTSSANYAITVNAAVTISPAALPADTVNVPYSQAIAASGATNAFYANQVVSYAPGAIPDAGYNNPAAALGGLNPTVGSFEGVNYYLTPFDPAFDSSDLVEVGAGGSLVLKLAQTASTNGDTIGVHTGFGLADADYPNGTNSDPASSFDSFVRQADVMVSADGVNWGNLGTITFDNPSNYYAGEATDPEGLSPGVGPLANPGQPFLGSLSSFNGENWQQTLATLNGSAGGTWLNLSGVTDENGNPISGVNYIEFSVPGNPPLDPNTGNSEIMMVDAVVGTNSTANISANGGTGAVTLAVSNIQHAVPGLNVPSSGVGGLAITGTPTASGTETFTVTATDAVGATTTTDYSITVNPAIALSTLTLPADTINVPYNQTIDASGGTGAVTLAVSDIQNAIPGLNVSSSGAGAAISGTPTAAGTETFTVTATDAVGGTTTTNYAVTVNSALTLSTTTQTVVVTSYFDSAVYEFDANTGALLATLVAPNSQAILSGPSGLTVGPDGNLYFSSQANDSIVEYNFSTQTLSTFIPASVLTPIATANGDSAFAPAGLLFGPDGSLYVSLNGGQSATSGGAVLRFNISSSGGQLSYAGTFTTIATGLIQPTELTFGRDAGDRDNLYVSNSAADTVVKITDADGASPTSSTFISAGSGGLNYPSGLIWGGDGKLYVVDLGATSPNLGQVLRYNADGSFDEVFTQPSASLQYQFPSDALFLANGDLLTANLGLTYPVAFGGPGTSGSLTEFNADGTFNQVLSGSAFRADPTTGVTNFSPSQLALDTTAPATLSSVVLAQDTVDVAYNQTIASNGGTGAVTFAVSNVQNAIAGLILPSSGASSIAITGTPTASGTETFTVIATDSLGSTTTTNYSITVNPTVTLGPTVLPADTVNISYNQTIAAAGGTGVVTLAVSVQNAIPGLTISGSGTTSIAVTGVPTAAGTETVTVTATDALGNKTTTNYAITVNPAVTLSPATLPADAVNTPYNQTITTTGGTGAITFTVSDIQNALAGLSVPGSGAGSLSIGGTPTVAGTETFMVTATDSVGDTTGPQPYSVTVDPAGTLTLSPATLTHGAVGSSYGPIAIDANGGFGAYTFTLLKTNSLPPGLALSSGGVLNGTPTATGTYSFTILATDKTNSSLVGRATYSVTVSPALAVSPTALPVATGNDPFSTQLKATGGSGVGYVFTSSDLPTWLTLFNTGLLSGTPPATSGVLPDFHVTVTDSNDVSRTFTYALPFDSAVTLTPTLLPVATVGDKFSQQLSTAGGSHKGYTFTLSTHPTWLTLSAAGVLSGTPPATANSTVNFTVTVADSARGTVSTNYTLKIDPALVLSPTTLTVVTGNDPFSTQLTAAGGAGANYTFTEIGLPNWATLTTNIAQVPGAIQNSATLAGTPLVTTSVETFHFTVTATDDSGGTVSHLYSLTVNPALVVKPITLPKATVGDNFSQQLTPTGGSGTGYAFASSDLPTWLTLSPNGLLSGMPPATIVGSPVSFDFSVKLTDSNNASGTAPYTLTVDPALAVAFNNSAAVATVGDKFSQQLSASGGFGSGYVYTLGNHPAWLTLSAAGILSGTPPATANSSVNFMVKVTDGAKGVVSTNFTLTIDPALVLSPSTLTVVTVNNAFSTQLTTAGGSGTGYSFTIGTHPTWLALSTGGLLSGIPTTAVGSPFHFTVTSTDSMGGTVSHVYSLSVNPALVIRPVTLPTATVGDHFSQQLTPAGGSGTGYAFASAGLPAWLTLSPTGLLSGTPSTPTGGIPLSFTVTLTDSNNATGGTPTTYALTVDPAFTITTSALAVATVGDAFSTQLAAAGGSGAGYSYTQVGLPAGMKLSATGLLSGTPTSAAGAPFIVTVTVTDSAGGRSSHAFSLQVDPALVLSPLSLPIATVANSYSTLLTTSGGSGPGATFTAVGLPAGLNLSSAGLLSGTPTTATGSPFHFTVTATDSDGGTASHVYALTVHPALVLHSSALPNATIGIAYHTQLTASGGSGIVMAFSALGLPGWLHLSSTGLLTGTPPTGAGSPVQFTVTATDSDGATVSQIYTLAVV